MAPSAEGGPHGGGHGQFHRAEGTELSLLGTPAPPARPLEGASTLPSTHPPRFLFPNSWTGRLVPRELCCTLEELLSNTHPLAWRVHSGTCSPPRDRLGQPGEGAARRGLA